MERGYVKLWRKTLDSEVWADGGLFQTWGYCLMRANHKRAHVPVRTGRGTTIVTLDPGQFLYGRGSAGLAMRQPPETVRDRMRRLKNLGMVTIQPTKQYSIVTICNWETYQHTEDAATPTKTPTKTPGKHQPSATDKNEKKNTGSTDAAQNAAPNDNGKGRKSVYYDTCGQPLQELKKPTEDEQPTGTTMEEAKA